MFKSFNKSKKRLLKAPQEEPVTLESIGRGNFKSFFESNFDVYASNKDLDFKYESEKLPYVVPSVYIPDFIFTSNKTGKKVAIEFKGYLKVDDRTKLIAAAKTYPDIEFRIVFMTNNKISKESSTRYTAWASKHGFKSHVVGKTGQYLPEDWVMEFKKVEHEAT